MTDKESAPSERSQRIAARRARVTAMKPKVECVRVMAAKPEYCASLAHPSGAKFGADGSAEWPLDKFTKRRLRDGSITREKKREEPTARRRAE